MPTSRIFLIELYILNSGATVNREDIGVQALGRHLVNQLVSGFGNVES